MARTETDILARQIEQENKAAEVVKDAADALDNGNAALAKEISAPWLQALAGFGGERAATIRAYCRLISAEASRREGAIHAAAVHLDSVAGDLHSVDDDYQRNFLSGWLHKIRGLAERDGNDLDAARAAFHLSKFHYEQIDVASGAMDALTELATIEENANQYGAAFQYYDAVEHIAKQNGLLGGLAVAHRGRATIAFYRDDIPKVLSHAETARELFHELKQEVGVAECEMLLGQASVVRGAWSQAEHWFEAANGRFHRLKLPRREASVLLHLGQLAILRGQVIAAKQMIVEADDYFAKAGYGPGRTSSFLLLASAERQLGNLNSAREALRRATQYAQGSEDRGTLSQIVLENGLTALAASELPVAERLLREAEALAYRSGELATESRAIAARIPVSAASSAVADAAIERLASISARFRALERPLEAAGTDVRMAEQLNRLGKADAAGDRAEAGFKIAVDLGSRLLEGEALIEKGFASLVKSVREAEADFQRALVIGTDLPRPQIAAFAEIGLIEAHILKQELDEAEEHIPFAAEWAITAGNKLAMSYVRRAEGLVAQARGRTEEARKAFGQAALQFSAAGYKQLAEAMLLNVAR